MIILRRSRFLVLDFLGDGVPRCSNDILKGTGLSGPTVLGQLRRCWEDGLVIRTDKPSMGPLTVFRGRNGKSVVNRPFHLYTVPRGEGGEIVVDGRRFVEYDEKFLDPRGGGSLSKAERVIDFLRENVDKAWFSREVVEGIRRVIDVGLMSMDNSCTKNPERIRWARVVSQAVSVANKVLKDKEIEELSARIDLLERLRQ